MLTDAARAAAYDTRRHQWEQRLIDSRRQAAFYDDRHSYDALVALIAEMQRDATLRATDRAELADSFLPARLWRP